MPEIIEVRKCADFIKKHLTNKKNNKYKYYKR